MSVKSSSPSDIFQSLFNVESISSAYDVHIAPNGGRGIDRIDSAKFDARRQEHFEIISMKCLEGTYKFSPFVERLQSKGQKRPPRVISIATLRDRIVLFLLKEYLHRVFSECVNRKLPNEYVRDVKQFFASLPDPNLCFYKTDITEFYDTINQENLLRKLGNRISSKTELALIRRAIRTPTVPVNYRKDNMDEVRKTRGIPQGLAISNILANIYLSEADRKFQSASLLSLRYVDDILMVVKQQEEKVLKDLVNEELKALHLTVAEKKTHFVPLQDGLDYLGYNLQLPKVSVRQSTVERFLRLLSAKFASCSHKGLHQLYPNIDEGTAKEVFISDVNERITGAISENRRYGWLFYFLEMNDMPLLFKMDSIIRDKFFCRVTQLGIDSTEIKRLVKAYYQAKFDIFSGYIHNYDSYDTTPKKLEYLRFRGVIRPDDERLLSPDYIDRLFARVKAKQLSDLDTDAGDIS